MGFHNGEEVHACLQRRWRQSNYADQQEERVGEFLIQMGILNSDHVEAILLKRKIQEYRQQSPYMGPGTPDNDLFREISLMRN